MEILIILLPILLMIALLTLLERKVLSFIQKRRGPNVIGIFGLFQPFADAMKLLLKEVILPNSSNKFLFIFASIYVSLINLLGWLVIPFFESIVILDISESLLYSILISSSGVYGIIFSGWASNSRYAFLGSLRSTAQMLSYEISFSLLLLNLVIRTKSLNLIKIVLFQEKIWFIIPYFFPAILFSISLLAETNRTPFDLTEAEAELVSGYNIEYSSINFALFFVAEYGNILLVSFLFTILFLGGWTFFFITNFFILNIFFFSLKIYFILFLFIRIRATNPRSRYDQLMNLGWKNILPQSLIWLIITVNFLVFFS